MDSGDEFHVTCANDGWSIEVGDDRLGTPRPTRSIAVWTAENLARERPGSRIVVHATDGSVVVEYPAPTGRIDPPWAWRPA